MFAICAYKDSPYLEACIRSVLGQNYPTKAIICTSTPSRFIEGLAKKYNLPYYVREGKSNIRDDWNFAYRMADARLVTIAHQDDCYRAGYVRAMVNAFRRFPDMTVFASDAITVKDGHPQPLERLRLVKKFLRLPLRSPYANHLSRIKKAPLSLEIPSAARHVPIIRMSWGKFYFPRSFSLRWTGITCLRWRKSRGGLSVQKRR